MPRLATVLTTVLFASAFGTPHGRAQAAAQRTGEEIYRAACLTCHGPDGRGAARERLGFDTPLPDFTDCRFTTPEPDSDWMAVIHRGGPARAFDRRMPAFGDALAERDITRVSDYLRSFCTDRSWPRGELNLPRALFTEKAFPEDEAVITTTVSTGGTGAIGNELVYERRVGARNQLEVSLPFSAERVDERWVGGFGDLAVGVKRALAHSLERGAILSVSGELILPTQDDALGESVTRFEPSLSFGQILGTDGFLHAQGGVELSTDRDRAAHEAFWRAAVGRSFAQAGGFGRAWAPMLEVLGARELESGRRIEWDLVPQLQVTLSTRQHIMISGGVRLPVSERDRRHAQVAMYFLWDWFDGALTAGW